MPSSDRPVSDVLHDIAGNMQDIVQSEVRLAKAEIREEVTKAKVAGLLLSSAALSGIFGVFFLLLTIVYVLSNVVPNWAAALIVAGALVIFAGITLSIGLKRLQQVHSIPEKTIENLKEDVAWAKQQIK